MTTPAVSTPSLVQKVSAFYQDLKEMDWRFIAVTIAEISLQIFCTYWTLFVFVLITPASISPVVLPIAALCSAAIAPFLLTPARPEPLSPEVPRGIYQEGNNCWINTQFQMMMADADIKNWILSDACPPELLPFQAFAKEYEAASRGGRAIVNLNSQALRECLHRITQDRINASSLVQQDMAEGLSAILGRVPDELKVDLEVERVYGQGNVPVQPLSEEIQIGRPRTTPERSFPEVHLAINSEINPSLDDLMQSHMRARNPGVRPMQGMDLQIHDYPILEETSRFSRAPRSLWIGLKRFRYEVDLLGNVIVDQKIQTPVAIPETYQIDPTSEPPAMYKLDAFAVHIGETRNSGHYISFSLKNGHWYQINGHVVTRINGDEMRRNLQNAYAVHYSKCR